MYEYGYTTLCNVSRLKRLHPDGNVGHVRRDIVEQTEQGHTKKASPRLDLEPDSDTANLNPDNGVKTCMYGGIR